jgi:hypothetical protein
VSGLLFVVFVYKPFLNVMSSLLNCLIVEQQAVFHFLWSEGVKTSEIYRRMLAQYGEHCMAQKNVYEWMDRFKCGRTTLDDERSGWPSTSWTNDHSAEVNALTKENRRMCISEIALIISISYESAFAVHEVTDAVHTWLWSQPKIVSADGIRRLVN